ncbi:uncharacterized protein LOC114517066 [Dendronephthya gigantea]|uniref:uncharacterized protein LOC114517066 n=1 Tax=Dendronephthya gigantea TaxID=151771 RepID=UPI00106D449C|nr:uncharacterized protein LOC114517066 [Dendronephthya gigantea]
MGSMDNYDDQNNIQEQLEADDRPILTDVEGEKKEFKKKREYSLWKKLRNLARFDIIDISLKVLFIVLSVPWFISTIFFSIFDTKCIIFDHASVVNCSQDIFIYNPRHWVFAWFSMSIVSSIILIFIVRANYRMIDYQTDKAKKIFKKGYFVSLMLLLLVSMVYYGVRLYNTRAEATSLSISFLILFHVPVSGFRICCLNYLPRVRWKDDLQRRTQFFWIHIIQENSNFIIYWLALILYFFESACRVASVMLDVAEKVAPLVEKKFPDEVGQYRAVLIIVTGFRLAFHARVLTFYWQKIFHGDKDLFSEPNSRLVDEPLQTVAVAKQEEIGRIEDDNLPEIV